MREILRSWIREQLWSDPRSQSKFYYSEFQVFTALRFWIASKYTELNGYMKRFWTTICSRRTIQYNLQPIKEFYILFSGIETEIFLTFLEFQSWKVNFKTNFFENSKSSSHDAFDQRIWDSKVNSRAYDIAIDKWAPRLRCAWCDDCVRIIYTFFVPLRRGVECLAIWPILCRHR